MKSSMFLLLLLTSCGGYMYPEKWKQVSALCGSNGGLDHVYSVVVGKDKVLCKNKATFEVFYGQDKKLKVY